MSKSEKISRAYVLKLCMLGDGGVGKSTLVERLATGIFNNHTKMTIGIDFQLINMVLNSENEKVLVDIAVWDLGGEDQFRFILPRYITGADGALLLFDASRIRTMDDLPDWVELWRKHTHPDTPLYLIGSKLDTVQENFMPVLESSIYSLKENLYIDTHYLTSSKTGANIHDVITAIAKDMVEFKKVKRSMKNEKYGFFKWN